MTATHNLRPAPPRQVHLRVCSGPANQEGAQHARTAAERLPGDVVNPLRLRPSRWRWGERRQPAGEAAKVVDDVSRRQARRDARSVGVGGMLTGRMIAGEDIKQIVGPATRHQVRADAAVLEKAHPARPNPAHVAPPPTWGPDGRQTSPPRSPARRAQSAAERETPSSTGVGHRRPPQLPSRDGSGAGRHQLGHNVSADERGGAAAEVRPSKHTSVAEMRAMLAREEASVASGGRGGAAMSRSISAAAI